MQQVRDHVTERAHSIDHAADVELSNEVYASVTC